MSHSLNSLKGGYIGDYIGTTIGVVKGDTRSLDYSLHVIGVEAAGCPILELGRANLGGCQNYGPFLGTLNIRCRIMIGTQKGMILTTTHLSSNQVIA